jgi:DNA modification methylase
MNLNKSDTGNNTNLTGIIPIQGYVLPFWKHSDIEIYNENNLETMARMPDNCISLTVTSPPYDDIRKYNGYCFEFEKVAKELYRITKPGGVVVWVVGDQTLNGSETGTSFRQALGFMETGWNLHDTMIYEKDSISFPETNRYSQIFEYMFVFSKGKPNTTNIIKDRKNLWSGNKKITGRGRQINGELGQKRKGNELLEFGSRFNIWRIPAGCNKSTTDEIAFKHPAIFPERLAADHIHSWSNEGDVIYEPFGGSGTVAKMAHLMNRKCIMSEISKEYCEISVKRLTPYVMQYRLLA